MKSLARCSAGRPRRLVYEPLEPRRVLAGTPLVTEFMASNDRTLDDEDGDDSDWVEIYNPTPEPVDLGGWYLTDNQRDLDKWRFPSVVLDPGGSLVVFASDKDRATAGGELHTNFKLDADGEYVALVMPDGSIASEMLPGGGDFPPQQTDVSFGRSMSVEAMSLLEVGATARIHVPESDKFDGEWMHPDFDDSAWEVGATGIGYETSRFPTRTDLIETELPVGTTSVYIRMPFTVSPLTVLESLTLRMHYDDGFIAYMNGVRVASANAPHDSRWDSTATQHHRILDEFFPFEEFRLNDFRGAIREGGNVLAIHGLNAPLETSANPDLFFLVELAAIDATLLPGSPGLLPRPTPGLPNEEVVGGFVEAPTISMDRGFYDEPFDVVLHTPTPNVEIRYTTSGTPPTAESGSVYTGPLTIDRTTTLRVAAFRPGYAPSPVVTQTYIFVDDVVQQDFDAILAAGFPPTWGGRPADYGMDPDIVGANDLFGGVYAATIRDDLRALPTLSIAVDVDQMFGPEGIYTNPVRRGPNWERAASVELVDPANEEEFQSDVALRIHGGASRGMLKKSLRLLFKSDYGPPMLEFPFFGSGAAQEFNTLVLRMEFNDGILGGGHRAQYARDEFARRTQLAMGWPSAHGRYVHVYINGIYWGVYNAAERPDAAFTASYYGGEREDWDAIKAAPGLPGHIEALDGDLKSWYTLLDLAREVSSAATEADRTAAFMRLQGFYPDGTRNPAWESYLNVDNYIDYLIVNFYTANTDWPGHNWYAARRRGPESEGFVFHIWDAEWTLGLVLGSGGTNRLDSNGGVAEPYGDLRSSEEFRIRFADRVQRHFFNGGPLYSDSDPRYPEPWDPVHPEDNVPAARYVEVTEEVRRGLVAESARWGDAESETPFTPNEHWEVERQDLLQDFFPRRSAIVLRDLRTANLFPRLDAPVFRQHGGVVPSGFELVLTSTGESKIYYTLDGSDPRLIGGGISPTAVEYTGPITATDGMRVRARALEDGTWSALDEAKFEVDPSLEVIAGDYNGNGRVEQADLDLVLAHWGEDAAASPDGWKHDQPGGHIDQDELDAVLLNWGTTADAAPRAAYLGPVETSVAATGTRSPFGQIDRGGHSDGVRSYQAVGANPLVEGILEVVIGGRREDDDPLRTFRPAGLG